MFLEQFENQLFPTLFSAPEHSVGLETCRGQENNECSIHYMCNIALEQMRTTASLEISLKLVTFFYDRGQNAHFGKILKSKL